MLLCCIQGYPEAEARVLLDQGCAAVLRERREAALNVFTQALRFLQWQVSNHWLEAHGLFPPQLAT